MDSHDVGSQWYGMIKMQIYFYRSFKHMRKPPSSAQVWVFGLTNSPISIAKSLIDAMRYVC